VADLLVDLAEMAFFRACRRRFPVFEVESLSDLLLGVSLLFVVAQLDEIQWDFVDWIQFFVETRAYHHLPYLPSSFYL
jgi:hypothetical protein